jgi:hypothetical protein
MTEYIEHLNRLKISHRDLAVELASFRSLERLLPWLRERGQELAALDLITQDEFSYDLLVPLGRSGEWLSFGMG